MATIIGTLGRDSLSGTGDDDTLYGGGEITVPRDEADTLSGAGGNDRLYGNGGADILLGGAGTDVIYGGLLGDTLYGGDGVTSPNDSADRIYGQDGRDVLYGNGGHDTLLGGDWSDTIYGGEGDDIIKGGNDAASIGDGGDWIAAGPGQDVIEGQEGNDTIYGGTGRVDEDDDEDTIDGGDGHDVIYGNGGDDSIVGGAGNDTLYSGLGIDTLEGGAGNDRFTLGFTDQATGGEGIDSFILDASTLPQGGSFGELLRITDLEAGESLQITGTRKGQTASVREDDQGNAIITIDGVDFAQLDQVSSRAVKTLNLTPLSNPSQAPGNPTFGITASGGDANRAPTLDDMADAAFAENTVNAAAQVIDSDVSFSDGGSLNNGFLEITYSSGGGAEDSLSVRNQGAGAGQIGFDGSDVSYEGTVIGSIDGGNDGSNGNDLKIIFNTDADDEGVEALLESLTYANSSDNPMATRTIELLLNDGSLESEPIETVLTVTPENDAPTVDNALVDQAGNVTAAFSYTFAANTFGDVDAGDSLTYTVQSGLPGWATFTAGTRTISGTPAAGQAATSSVTIRATDSSGAFVEDTFDITIGTTITGTVNADTLTGSAQDETFLALTGIDNIDAQGGDDSITLADWDSVSLPTAVSPGNLQLWLDASDSSTITESGGAVSEWRDKSGQGNDAANANLASQPDFRKSYFNGKNTIDLAGTKYLSLPGISSVNSDYTFLSVFQMPTAGGQNFYFLDTNSTGHRFLLYAHNGPSVSGFYHSNTWAGSSDDLTNTQLGSWVLETANGSFYRGGDPVLTGGPYTQNKLDNEIVLANRYSKNNATDLLLFELIAFDAALSDDDRQSLERYLSNKYGIELDASVPNSNDVIDGGAGTDTLTISSGQFMLNPGTLSGFNSIESFTLSGNNAAHEITLTDDYFDTNGGVESDLVTVNLSGNSTGSEINAATLTGTHAISVQGSDGNDTVQGGAGVDTYSFTNAAGGVNKTMAGDAIDGVENFVGSDFGDTLSGGLGNQTLTGGDGNDQLFGDVDVENFDVSAFASGNKLWLDANDAGTITDAGGSLVGQWTDKSGTGNHVSQATGSRQPSFATLRNGRTELSFDGADRLERFNVRGDDISSSDAASFFSVQRYDSSVSQTITLQWEDTGSNRISVNAEYNNAIYWDHGNYSGGGRTTAASPAGFDDNWHIVSASKQASVQGEIYVSGALLVNNTPTDTLDVSKTATLAVGQKESSVNGFKGAISEIILFDSALTTTDRQQIESYLAEKWGIGYAGTVNDEDSLSGGAGDDVLRGGVGDDTLSGGADNDTLEGGLDNDSLTGGTGDDIFIFKNSSGQDVITDFDNPGAAAGDLIHILTSINGNAITNFAQLSPHISQNGADTEIDLDPANPGTHVLTLTGITAADLTVADFVFI